MKIRQIDEKYRVEKLISKKGGFGKVFEVTDITDNKHYALKQQDMSEQMKNGRDDVHIKIRRIMREIQTIQLKHPSIIEVYDSFITDNGQFIMIQELGTQDLDQFKKSLVAKNEELDIHLICKIMIQILTGLEFIHKEGITHRDVSPDNILQIGEETFKICDFGVASFGSYTKISSGKDQYMAPEAYDETVNQDKTFDIWSAGVLLYYLCTGSNKYIFGNGQNKKFFWKYVLDNKTETLQMPQQYQIFQGILNGMLKFEPLERASIQDILKVLIEILDEPKFIYEYQKKIVIQQIQKLCINLLDHDFKTKVTKKFKDLGPQFDSVYKYNDSILVCKFVDSNTLYQAQNYSIFVQDIETIANFPKIQTKSGVNKIIRFTDNILLTGQDNGYIQIFSQERIEQQQTFQIREVIAVNDICRLTNSNNDQDNMLKFAFACYDGLYVGYFKKRDDQEYEFHLVEEQKAFLQNECSTVIEVRQNVVALSKKLGKIIFYNIETQECLQQLYFHGDAAIYQTLDYSFERYPYLIVKDYHNIYLLDINDYEKKVIIKSSYEGIFNYQSIHQFKDYDGKYKILDLKSKPNIFHNRTKRQLREIEVNMPIIY
ncbi:5-amp-activated protein kinase catalytic subunit alpha-1 [Stylonychia lemnae]|uniref:5-amp-activated protein kinase catalytic subunit alpha-1 n=1 Tax=Stylonychia lemnae TaxID=5949 RepID=A0A078AR67_STYLE|nr:5-amp-activated protein kinase catalytic subunit alpha-1 [Stylonychia lemnae]|eukprot:CDW83737.1 5-amp-activated protein kinase catalytic subunit alpha-1 [Stylonychia lemnae]